MSSQIKSEDRYLKHEELPRFCQGDILRDLEVIEWATVINTEPKEINLQKRLLPYAVVLSQECDLHQDQQNRVNVARPTQDKYLHSVLLGPAFQAQSVRQGTHLNMLGVKCEPLNSVRWAVVTQNNNDRYHFLPAFDPLQVPDIVIDFKHFLTAPRAILLSLKPNAYIASLGQLFRENLSQRFANFLSRIALPDPLDEAEERKATEGAA
jgi:hypothetical protein